VQSRLRGELGERDWDQLVFALIASTLNVFRNDAERVGIVVAIAALAPIVAFAVWYAASEGFRKFAMSLNPRILTALQTWRLIEFTFLLLEAHSVLPAIFVLPTGYGEMAIGATAALVAWQLAEPGHRNSFIVWQLVGITDLILAVGLGTTTRLLVFLIFHVICIAQTRNWRAVDESRRRTVRTVQHPVICTGLNEKHGSEDRPPQRQEKERARDMRAPLIGMGS
jgi:hypothetical protein